MKMQSMAESVLGDFQNRVRDWMLACFGERIAMDRSERCHRFLEESLELVQSLGCTESEAMQLVRYVYGRPTGETAQEIGGVMVTLAALCQSVPRNMETCGEQELARVWTKIEQIRAKQAGKPKHSPLPGSVSDAMDHDVATRNIRELLDGIFWPADLRSQTPYVRVHDDCDGDASQRLSVIIGDDGDAWIAADAPTVFNSLRFREPFIGGGMSPRVRNALLILAEAIRLDNADRPQRLRSSDAAAEPPA